MYHRHKLLDLILASYSGDWSSNLDEEIDSVRFPVVFEVPLGKLWNSIPTINKARVVSFHNIQYITHK
jgi:hypothetical protein